jgi:uncharacterized membrane protein YcaP (DUF421 family)
MKLMWEFFILFVRIITIIPLLLITTLYMGKRSIGELPVFDFLIVITLGAVVGADIADPKIQHIHTAVAIVLIGLFQRIVSGYKIRNRKFGHIITFEPTIVIQDGRFIVSNLKKIRFTIDNVLQMLREKDVFDISEVHLGIVEANGRLTVLKKPEKNVVTVEDLKIANKTTSLSYPLIIDGEVHHEVLAKLALSTGWLKSELNSLGISDVQEVFFASVNMCNELHISLRNFPENKDDVLPLVH